MDQLTEYALLARDSLKSFGATLVKNESSVWHKLLLAFGATSGLLVFRYSFLKLYQRYYLIPPGLVGVPYLGSIFTLGIYEGAFNTDIAPSYGPIASYTIGKQYFYILNDINLVEKILKHIKCINRPMPMNSMYGDKKDGIKHYGEDGNGSPELGWINNDELWYVRRTLINNCVMTSIAKRNFVDSQVKHVFEKFIFDSLDKHVSDRQMWEPSVLMRNLGFNTVFGAMYGEKEQLDENNPIFNKIVNAVHEHQQAMGVAFLIKCLPGLNITSFQEKAVGFLKEFIGVCSTYNDKLIQKFEEKKDKESNNENETLFGEMYKEFSTNANPNHGMNRAMLNADSAVVINGGSSTIAYNMQCGLIYAAKYPQLQEKVAKELLKLEHTNSKNGRIFINLEDVSKCVILRAFVHETMRMAAGTPRAGPRQFTQTMGVGFNLGSDGHAENIELVELDDSKSYKKQITELLGELEYKYIIPKDAVVEPNSEYIMTSDSTLKWNGISNPKEFNMNRWIKRYSDKDELKFYNCSYSIPFSVGPRQCPAMAFALKEMYCSMANLLVNYQFSLKDPEKTNVTYATSLTKEVSPKISLIVTHRKRE